MNSRASGTPETLDGHTTTSPRTRGRRLWHQVTHCLRLGRSRKPPTAPERVLVIGLQAWAEGLWDILETCQGQSMTLQGVSTADDEPGSLSLPPQVDLVGHITALPQLVARHRPQRIILPHGESAAKAVAGLIQSWRHQGIHVEAWSTFYARVTGKVWLPSLDVPGVLHQILRRQPVGMQALKRALDLVCALSALCVSWPLFGLIALLTKLDSRGPVFFRQERVGQGGRVFTLTKFRTMVPEAELGTGPVWSQDHDPRVTRLGMFLRHTGLDELPQLLNIMKGDMSLVGPRPERPHFVALLAKDIPHFTARLAVKPGLTGWAQVRYGYGATIEDARIKLQFDLYYLAHQSIVFDARILLRTIPKVLGARVARQAPAAPSPPSTALRKLPTFVA